MTRSCPEDGAGPAGGPAIRKIHSLADLDEYTDMIVDDERGALIGMNLTDNCTMYRDIIGGTRMLQFENLPLAREIAVIVLEHLPSDAQLCNAEFDPGGCYLYYRCASDVPSF